MRILIVGGGKVGTYLAKALLDEGHEVRVVESDPRRVHDMANVLERDVALLGDGCRPDVLERAGVDTADVVVADTGDDEDNLAVVLMARKRARPPRTIARVNNPKNEAIFDSIGTDTVISSTELVLRAIAQEIDVERVSPLITLRKSNLALVKLSVPERSPARGVAISAIGLPRDCVVVALERDGELLIPSGETAVEAGDTMLILAKPEARGALRDHLIGS
ncbi:MAG TPA: NAD-binding protein [Candidatus Dormibacteraeota bacterium]|nr:NAD-binding protein [Candidatus Dormibacteraeota bacterium]